MSSGPPPGIDLNADIKRTVLSPVIALMALATISVALRILSKTLSTASLQVDDYLIFAALIVALGTGALTILACYRGLGRHIWNPSVELEAIVKILWAYEFLYGTVIPLTKLSIILFYYRLFTVPFFRRILYLVLFLVVGWWIAIIVVAGVQCQPYSHFWKQYVDSTATGRCINISAFFIGSGGASVFTDFFILISPVPMVWRLELPVMQKVSVLSIFALGGFACVAGAIRIFFLTKMFKSADLTWNMSQSFIWSSVEPNIGIICACLPTLLPLARRYIPEWFGGSNMSTSYRPAYSIGLSRHRSQNGDLYTLKERKKNIRPNDNGDEIGLADEYKVGNSHQPSYSLECGVYLAKIDTI